LQSSYYFCGDVWSTALCRVLRARTIGACKKRKPLCDAEQLLIWSG
jgi:hypothetical protein